LHALPVFHVHGLFVALHTAFLNGSRMLWRSRFDVEEVMRLLPEATVMMGVPTFYTRLLAREDFTRDQCRSMRLFVSGSAPLLAETHQAFQERSGHRILERYGMTEAGMITSNPYQGGQRVAGTVGYALPGISLRVADEGGRELAAGDIGTLEVRGPNVFKGYWRMPEKTAEEFRDDGYFITGDMATIAEDGRVSIVGRSKDLIISGGFNVYPKEIEQELDQLEGIGESAVIGLAHPDFGEGVVAVVTSAGSVPANEADIISALDGRLARFKLPKRVFVVDALPRNAMGKVQKAELRVRFAGTFEG
ncbi:MAG: AMP-binding protein, partial [Hyphomicrobiaceae bacterium]